MQQPLVSVIVPIYKVEPYLRRCLDSIVNQTYTNLEIILVDDGSPDGCPAICDEYAAKDNRIVVIHKENGGLSDARNAGLDICKGEFVYFIDSDDFIVKDCISILFSALKKNDADIAIANYTSNTINFSRSHFKSDTFQEISLFDLVKKMCWGDIQFTQVVVSWNKLIKKDIATQNFFPVGKICEDNYTTHKYYFSASKIIISNVYTYFYQQRSDSIVKKLSENFSKNELITLDYLHQRMLFFIQNNHPEISDLFLFQFIERALNLIVTSKLDQTTINEIANMLNIHGQRLKKRPLLKFFAKHPMLWKKIKATK